MTYKISLKGKFHFFSVNTLTLWLPRLTVALKHYVNLALCNTPQTLVMCCVFICICLCVCTCTCVCVYIYSPQELCERLTCRNWFKLNKSKWRLSHSTSSSSAFSMIFFFFYRLLRRWAYKLICNPFKHTFRSKVTCGVTVMVSVIPCGSVWECSRDVGEWSRMTSVQPVYWQGADYYTELASPSLQPP